MLLNTRPAKPSLVYAREPRAATANVSLVLRSYASHAGRWYGLGIRGGIVAGGTLNKVGQPHNRDRAMLLAVALSCFAPTAAHAKTPEAADLA